MNVPLSLKVMDVGKMAYKPAWDLQKKIHAQMVADVTMSPVLIFVEHDPVITISQRQAASTHLVASREDLVKLGIDVQPTDRGGDITYHGPGQLVAYPILRMATFELNVGRYMRLLEDVVMDALTTFGVQSQREPGNTGVWVNCRQGLPAKLCAMGVRVSRNITLHGLALNVNPDLRHFNTIVPCGLTGRSVTSLQAFLGDQTPSMDQVKNAIALALKKRLGLL